MPIKNPIEWSVEQARVAAVAVGSTGADWRRLEMERGMAPPAVARIGLADLRDALAKGYADFGANRTDVMLLCIFYPVLGLVLGRIASGEQTLPLLFPLISGFALIGPLAAVGLYEISRRREQGANTGWADAFGVLRSPSLGPIVILGLSLGVLFVVWLAAAQFIYSLTLGAGHAATFAGFTHAVLATPSGWAMIAVGMAVGFVFALIVLTLGVVSFPMLIDRDVGVETALRTSVRAVRAQSRADGRLGPDRRGRAGARLDPTLPGPGGRAAHPRARDLAPLPEAGAALTPAALRPTGSDQENYQQHQHHGDEHHRAKSRRGEAAPKALTIGEQRFLGDRATRGAACGAAHGANGGARGLGHDVCGPRSVRGFLFQRRRARQEIDQRCLRVRQTGSAVAGKGAQGRRVQNVFLR